MRRHFLLIVALLTILFGMVVEVPTSRAVSPNIQIYSDNYRNLLDKYRLQYDRTTVALQQYANLKTLASQEEAVQTMRDFLLIRDDVIVTHLNLLGEVLHDRTTLDPQQQASASALLDSEKTALIAHRSRSDVAVDRIKADQEAEWFSKEQARLLMVADRMQSLIGIGKDEEAIKALESVKSHLDTWISSASMSETQRVEKRRGSDELGRTIEAAKTHVANAKIYYAQTVKNDTTSQIYGYIRPDLLAAYTQVQRGVEFAKELSQ